VPGGAGEHDLRWAGPLRRLVVDLGNKVVHVHPWSVFTSEPGDRRPDSRGHQVSVSNRYFVADQRSAVQDGRARVATVRRSDPTRGPSPWHRRLSRGPRRLAMHLIDHALERAGRRTPPGPTAGEVFVIPHNTAIDSLPTRR